MKERHKDCIWKEGRLNFKLTKSSVYDNSNDDYNNINNYNCFILKLCRIDTEMSLIIII